MLNMNPYDFDQSDAGWRRLDAAGKFLEAAESIIAYIESNKQKIEDQDRVSMQTMYFHAGQEYAMAGSNYYQKAIAWFSKSHKGLEDWDIYVDGTIAFLEGNGARLKLLADKLHELSNSDKRLSQNARLLADFYKGILGKASYAEVYDATT